MGKKKRRKAELASLSAGDVGPKSSPQGSTKSKWKDLNFKVDPDYYYLINNLAAQHRLTKVELLRRAMALYMEKHGGPVLLEAQLE